MKIIQCAILVSLTLTATAQDDLGWPAYLGGLDSSQYSTLDQINTENVANLEVAWTYHSGDASDSGRTQVQCNPLIIDNIIYATTAALNVVALDAATGQERWRFDPAAGTTPISGANRGLNYWTDGTDARILFGARQTLYALDAKTGAIIESFGTEGKVDLRQGFHRNAEDFYVLITTPGVVFEDTVILGSRLNENHPAAPGDIRAFDVRTGEIRWSFHTIPHPGELGYDTWPENAYLKAGGANSWGGMSLDLKRGIVYIPTGSAVYDFYGADRPGDNLFANCLIALDARTGERKWHYQIVRHDLWDRDLPAPPNLLTINHEGKLRDVAAQITKSGHVFVFDRDTGEPIFPIEEISAPTSDLPGEQTAATQPLPTAPPAFSRQEFRVEDVSNRTPEIHDEILQRLLRARRTHQFDPPSREGTVILPGFDGGGEWGGASHDPETGMLYVNASEMPWILQMIPIGSTKNRAAGKGLRLYAQNCVYCHGLGRQGDPLGIYPALVEMDKKFTRADIVKIILEGQGIMPSFGHLKKSDAESLADFLFLPPEETAMLADSDNATGFASIGYNRFVDPDGFPAIKPPWGTLNAIDLNKGTLAWKVTLGDRPEARKKSDPPTGTENYGGPLNTAGGLIFIAATNDEKIRAFDKATGKQLWETKLPAGGYATPSTFAVDGKQYVLIPAGGGKMGTPSGDAWIAYALP